MSRTETLYEAATRFSAALTALGVPPGEVRVTVPAACWPQMMGVCAWEMEMPSWLERLPVAGLTIEPDGTDPD